MMPLTLTKDTLLARRQALEADMQSVQQRARDTMNAIKGALDDCDYWLSLLESEEKKEELP